MLVGPVHKMGWGEQRIMLPFGAHPEQWHKGNAIGAARSVVHQHSPWAVAAGRHQGGQPGKD